MEDPASSYFPALNNLVNSFLFIYLFIYCFWLIQNSVKFNDLFSSLILL